MHQWLFRNQKYRPTHPLYSISGETSPVGGNQHPKAVLFFPAFAAIRVADQFKEYYQTVTVARNGTAGSLAMSRKILVLIYALWQNDTTYAPNYTKRLRVYPFKILKKLYRKFEFIHSTYAELLLVGYNAVL